MKGSKYFDGVDFGEIYSTPSPFAKLQEERAKEEAEEQLFREETLVVINGKTRRRKVGLSRKIVAKRIVHK